MTSSRSHRSLNEGAHRNRNAVDALRPRQTHGTPLIPPAETPHCKSCGGEWSRDAELLCDACGDARESDQGLVW